MKIYQVRWFEGPIQTSKVERTFKHMGAAAYYVRWVIEHKMKKPEVFMYRFHNRQQSIIDFLYANQISDIDHAGVIVTAIKIHRPDGKKEWCERLTKCQIPFKVYLNGVKDGSLMIITLHSINWFGEGVPINRLMDYIKYRENKGTRCNDQCPFMMITRSQTDIRYGICDALHRVVSITTADDMKLDPAQPLKDQLRTKGVSATPPVDCPRMSQNQPITGMKNDNGKIYVRKGDNYIATGARSGIIPAYRR